jgi:ribosomal protein S18 acetylase RimI-like enzyme
VADVSVRPAGIADVTELARIQRDTWQSAYRTLLPKSVLQALDVEALAEGWRAAVSSPPSTRHHVLVASEGPALVGFAAFGPDTDALEADPDVEHTAAITLLLVEPRWGRRGHGSRLLAAVADTAREQHSTRLIAWVPVSDAASLSFYRSAGWEADGLQRTLDTGSGVINELRLHAAL